MVTTTTAPVRAEPSTPGAGRKKKPRLPRSKLPYLLLLPAIALELLVHVIPMVVGVWMSLLELTQFQIRDWSAAPFAGLDNYRATLDINGPVGKELLHSFWVTVLYTTFSVG